MTSVALLLFPDFGLALLEVVLVLGKIEESVESLSETEIFHPTLISSKQAV